MSDMSPKERREKVKQLRESGMTFKAIGLRMGFGVERARQLYKSALRLEREEKEKPYLLERLEEARKHDARYVFADKLTTRAINALWRRGINTIEELKAADPEVIKKTRNVGAKTFDLIMQVKNEEAHNESTL